jgi:hypothetical protein
MYLSVRNSVDTKTSYMVLESSSFQLLLVADFEFIIIPRNIFLSAPASIYSVSKIISQFDMQRVRQNCYIQFNTVMRLQNILLLNAHI